MLKYIFNSRFQDKDFAKDPILTKERKRYVVGLRDTIKALKVIINNNKYLESCYYK